MTRRTKAQSKRQALILLWASLVYHVSPARRDVHATLVGRERGIYGYVTSVCQIEKIFHRRLRNRKAFHRCGFYDVAACETAE